MIQKGNSAKIAIVATSFSSGPTSIRKYVRNILSHLIDGNKPRRVKRILIYAGNSEKIDKPLRDVYEVVKIPGKIPNIKPINLLGVLILCTKIRRHLNIRTDVRTVFIP
ncbi:hypothetical protein, partial [Thermococcus sp. GR7]|uniref:hypothetical protein n=1 Tax=Thermococcus sp. GR7 TaxID=1638257 RepID=UPI00197E33BB